MHHPKKELLKSIVEDWIHFAPCLGVNISLLDSELGSWHGAAGYRSLHPKTEIQANEAFYIYSITKSFTALVMLKLHEKGLLKLDDDIHQYLANLPFSKKVTIRQLLNHTSGVPNYTEHQDYMASVLNSPSKSWNEEFVIEEICSAPFDFSPGEKWHYSNTGYMLLKMLMEGVTGLSFADNVKQLLTNDLPLRNTFVVDSILGDQITPAYCRSMNMDRHMENVTHKYDPGWCKTGLMVSTTDEICSFYYDLFNQNLLKESSMQDMTRAIPVGGDHTANPAYGLGLMIETHERFGQLFGHGGNGPGANTWSAYFPNINGRKVALAIFCNTSMGGHPFYLRDELLAAME